MRPQPQVPRTAPAKFPVPRRANSACRAPHAEARKFNAPLSAADGEAIAAARLRKDLSKIFQLPTVPMDVPLAPQPAVP